MKEYKAELEVQLVNRGPRYYYVKDTKELLAQLQEIVDEWCRKQEPTTPCSIISGETK